MTAMAAAAVLAAPACSDELMGVEDGLVRGNTITFAANSARIITKSGLQYEEFDVGTKYLLYGLPYKASSADYVWGDAIMYRHSGVETDEHLINYGSDLHFDGKTFDFYGATVCSDSDVPVQSNYVSDQNRTAPVIGLEWAAKDGVADFRNDLPDLMYSRNLKKCSSSDGLLEMQFTHALSRIEIEVSREAEVSENTKITGLTIAGTAQKGTLDIVSGKWTLEGSVERQFYSNGSGMTPPVGDPEEVMMGGEKAMMSVFPNAEAESGNQLVSLRVSLSVDGVEKSVDYPLYAPDSDGNMDKAPFLFEQNHRYVLSVVLLSDGIRIIAVRPQVYEWIPTPVEPYMGQPVTFGNLLWMDRNLGATSADCQNNWEDTRGFYYQFGRNIPYILDTEKFRKDTSRDSDFRTTTDGQLNIGYEYFYTYNDKGEKVYGAVQGGIRKNDYRFFTIGSWDESTNKWVGTRIEHYEAGRVYYSSSSGGLTVSSDFRYNGRTKDSDGHLQETYSSTGENKYLWGVDAGTDGLGDVTSGNIAINPGDPGIYHFIFDANYFHDYLQSGCWCVEDCGHDEDGADWRRTAVTSGTSNYAGWLTSGCPTSAVEDADKVNYYWADADGTPIPENHPCPKGWRIPTKEDFATIMPDHTIHKKWAKNWTSTDERYNADTLSGYYMYYVKEVVGAVVTDKKESAIYGVEGDGSAANPYTNVIYILKNKGDNDCYLLRLKWIDSGKKQSDIYGIGSGALKYMEVSRYSYTGKTFDTFCSSLGDAYTMNWSETDAAKIRTQGRRFRYSDLKSTGFYELFNWDEPSEKILIPICGFIYTVLGRDGMYDDGNMTILRCTDWSVNYDLAKYAVDTDSDGTKDAFSGRPSSSHSGDMYNTTYNEAMNWCAYIRTDVNTGLFSGSRKSLGCQIRCVRDVNATGY